MSENKSENHLFIIWSKAITKRREIVEDICNEFELINEVEVTWSKRHFTRNLSRFYGQKLPNNGEKQRHCGRGTFVVVIVKDHKPQYKDIDIGNDRGTASVNWNVYKKKKLYRKWTGGGHKIHATNDSLEYYHDIFLLFGKSEECYLRNELTTIYKKDLVGADNWESMKEFSSALKILPEYVILRGDLDDPGLLDETEDIDLLVSNYIDTCYILNAVNRGKLHSKNRHVVTVEGNTIHLDINVVGDGNYCHKWQIDMLKKSQLSERLSLLNPLDKYYSGIYHLLFHKGYEFEEEKKKELKEFMSHNDYRVTEPKDMTVSYIGDPYFSYDRKSMKRYFFEFYMNIRMRIYYARKNLL